MGEKGKCLQKSMQWHRGFCFSRHRKKYFIFGFHHSQISADCTTANNVVVTTSIILEHLSWDQRFVCSHIYHPKHLHHQRKEASKVSMTELQSFAQHLLLNYPLWQPTLTKMDLSCDRTVAPNHWRDLNSICSSVPLSSSKRDPATQSTNVA